MSRRAQAPVRTILPDPKFNNEMLAKFMNVVMKNGKKAAAERIIYGALDRIAEKTGKQGGEAIEVLSTALDNEKSMAFRLAHELMDASESPGAAVRKREDTHRMAEANKAFAHYRW